MNCSPSRVTQALPLLGLILIAPQQSAAQAADNESRAPQSAEVSPLVGDPHPSLFRDLAVEGWDYIEASVAVEDKGATVSWAPFLFSTEYSFWSETRLQLSQKDDVTSLGLSLAYNPLNPRSDHGKDLWSPGLSDPLGVQNAKGLRIDGLKEQIADLLSEQADDRCPNVIEAPSSWDPDEVCGTLPDSWRCDPAEPLSKKPSCEDPADRLTSLACEVQSYTIQTGLAISENLLYRTHCALKQLGDRLVGIPPLESSVHNPGVEECLACLKRTLSSWSWAGGILEKASERAYYEAHETNLGTTCLSALRSELAQLEAEVKEADAAWAEKAYLDFRKSLFRSKKPVLRLSYLTSYFKVLSGGETDADADGSNDNEHTTKSRSLTASALWRLGEKDALSLLLTRSNERPSAEAGTPDADYTGLGATWSHRLAILNRKGYAKTEDFKKSLFIPSIAFGLAYEQKECDSPDEDCAKGILRTQALTPFLDFKLSKKAQFRIGVPLKRDRLFRSGEGSEDQETIEVVSLVALQLGAPK